MVETIQILFVFLIIGIVLAIAILFVIESLFLGRYNAGVDRNSYDLLIKGIKQQTLDEESAFSIYKKSNEKKVSFFYIMSFSYEEFLESFLYYVREQDDDGTLTTTVNMVIKPIIAKIKEENDYSGINERERRIFLSIDDTTKKSTNLAEGEKAAIKHNLEDLARALEENQNALKKSKKSNKLTWLSILITVIFGIISIILYYFG